MRLYIVWTEYWTPQILNRIIIIKTALVLIVLADPNLF